MLKNETVMHVHECKCFAWKPIIAGAIVMIGLSFLLNLFSVAIGLTAFTSGDEGVENLVLSGLFATAIGIIASMFAGGWVSGYLGQNYCTRRHLGALYGFLAWGIALIVTIFLASHIKEYINFYVHFLSGTTDLVASSPAAPPADKTVTVATNVKTQNIAISTYIVFVLFFLSAFASSLGGHLGMRHICKSDRV